MVGHLFACHFFQNVLGVTLDTRIEPTEFAADRVHILAVKRMKHAKHLHYVYYHCTHVTTPTCTEGSVQELYIDNTLAAYFQENLSISKDLHAWCLNTLDDLDKHDTKRDSEKQASVESTLAKKQKEYKELVMMKARGMINDEDFNELKTAQKAEIKELETTLAMQGPLNLEKKRDIKKAFTLALGIDDIFKKGTSQEKKQLLRELHSNLTISDKKLTVCATGTTEKIIQGLLLAKTQNPSFEPRFCRLNKGQNDAFDTVCPTLLRMLDDVRNC